MKSYRRMIGNVLILAAIGLVAFWFYGVQHQSSKEKELLEAFRAVQAASAGNGSTVHAEGQIALDESVEGILSIPKIDLESPVLAGAGKEQLDVALGAIEGLDKPGAENGSYAIAGHQSHLFGHFFNRLYEVEEGDRFTFQTKAEVQQYEVFSVKIVRPEDVHVLDRQEGISLLSLVTCYPENSSRYRFIVQAKKIES